MFNFQSIFNFSIFKQRREWFLLVGVLLFVNLYSLATLTTKPAYWYDEAINAELARNFADFGKLDLIVSPNTFSGAGATVGSTGYPATVPLAVFFKVFGFGLMQARLYMLLWMSAFVCAFFFVAKKLWGSPVAYYGTLLIASFAPFYGNGRSVMGEIPGFLFFLLSFYFFEKRKFWLSGILLGLAVISKPSVFAFLIPAYAVTALCERVSWRKKFSDLLQLGGSAFLTLVPWAVIYGEELSRGGLGENILNHFKNPYQEAGISVWTNIGNNLAAFFQSTTLIYFTVLLVLVFAALYLDRALFRAHQNFFLLSAVYTPLALFQYLKSFGYLRYLIAAEFLVFILFVLALPVLVQWVLGNSLFGKGSAEPLPGRAREGFFNIPRPPLLISKNQKWGTAPSLIRGNILRLADSDTSPPSSPEATAGQSKKGGIIMGAILTCIVIVQTIHLFWFSDLYAGEKTQKTIAYLSSVYPNGAIGIMNAPQVGSFIPPERKYQYLSTYGLWQFGVNPILLSPERMPQVLVADLDDPAFSTFYERDTAFSEGFLVYRKR